MARLIKCISTPAFPSLCSSPGSSLHGLSSQYLYRPSSSGVYLVIHHVFESLVVGGAQEHLSVEFTTSETIVQNLITSGQSLSCNTIIEHMCIN